MIARRVLEALDTSWRSCPESMVSSTTIEIAGLVLRIEGAGCLPDRLQPALSHHPVSHQEPDLTIKVWDLETAAERPSVTPEFFQHDGARNLADDGGEVRCRYDWPQRVAMAWDREAGVAWWCAEHPDALEWWEEAAPFRPVLAWWLTSRQRYFVHGAALSLEGRATLLVGPGGSGKSTTALRAQRAGFGYIGDDYCIVASTDSEMGARNDPLARYQVASLYRTIKLRPVDGEPVGTPIARNEAGRKIVMALDGSTGGPVVRLADLVGVAAVSVSGEVDTSVQHGGAGSVLQALAPTSIEQLPGVGAASLPAFAKMLRELPTATVSLGTDTAGVLCAVRTLIEEPA